jgi:hypothetical protein
MACKSTRARPLNFVVPDFQEVIKVNYKKMLMKALMRTNKVTAVYKAARV